MHCLRHDDDCTIGSALSLRQRSNDECLTERSGDREITMALSRIDHVTILCSDLARSRAFYANALGFVDGDRPPFNFPGAWLWLGGRAVVHLVGGRNAGMTETGSFDHVAFAATDLEGTRARLKKAGIPFRETAVPGRPLHQIFVVDPDGVSIELNVDLSA
jgi:catechol 2,3-dioxygenase-like lactoylglutathione lyase family enzyme